MIARFLQRVLGMCLRWLEKFCVRHISFGRIQPTLVLTPFETPPAAAPQGEASGPRALSKAAATISLWMLVRGALASGVECVRLARWVMSKGKLTVLIKI